MARPSTDQLQRWLELAEDALTDKMPEYEWGVLDMLRQELTDAWVDAVREDANGQT